MNLLLILGVAAVVAAEPAQFDAGRLQKGSFRYRTLVAGKPQGESLIQIRKTNDRYVYSNAVAGAFAQAWEAIATRDFTPVSARLVFGTGTAAKAAFELSYRDGRVTGFSNERQFNAEIASDTVDQRIDWAAVMSLPEYQPGREATFHVYDPGGGNSSVSVRIGGTETVRVPAGKFQAVRVIYKIAKIKGTEEYHLLITERPPRLMLREEFPNGSITELVEAKP